MAQRKRTDSAVRKLGLLFSCWEGVRAVVVRGKNRRKSKRLDSRISESVLVKGTEHPGSHHGETHPLHTHLSNPQQSSKACKTTDLLAAGHINATGR